MRIAVWHNLPSGGGKRALYDHVRGLTERGHTVEAWCPPTADREYCPLSELVREHLVRTSWPPNGKLSSYTRGFYGATGAMDHHCRQCAEEISRGNFDLLIANSCKFLAVSSIGRHVKIPAVLYLQEPRRHFYEALPRLPWVAHDFTRGWWRSPGNLRRRAESFLRAQAVRVQAREELRNAQAFVSILVNSHYSRESILRAYGLEAKVCYLGIDTKRFINQKRPRENFVVGIGAFAPPKNVHFIIRALAHLGQRRPRLIWIGNFTLGSYLEELAQLARSEKVEFEPKLRIQDSELIDILNRASIMVYAPRLEPFGFAPLEGNACGLPVVAVPEGGVRETVVDGVNGLWVEHEPAALAAGIQHLLDHPDYARQLGENGCEIVAEKWTLKHSVDRLENRLIESLRSSAIKYPKEELIPI